MAAKRKPAQEPDELHPYERKADHVHTWFGRFGFNDCNVCVVGRITVVDLSCKSNSAEVTVARTPVGWIFGYHYGNASTKTGSGGGCGGIGYPFIIRDSIDEMLLKRKRGHKTIQKAAVAGCAYLLDQFTAMNKYMAGDTNVRKMIKLLEAKLDKLKNPEPLQKSLF